jgi:hypothetical protein
MDIDSPKPHASSYNFVLFADKWCGVSGLLHPRHRMHTLDTHTLFEAHLPRSVTKLKRGDIRPLWRRPVDGPSTPSGVLVDDIIGSCTDGTVYSFSILSETALNLLKVIQNLVELANDVAHQASIVTQKRSGNHSNPLFSSKKLVTLAQKATVMLRNADPDHRGPHVPKLRHVDGDVIIRYFGGVLAGSEYLEALTKLFYFPDMETAEIDDRLRGLAAAVGGIDAGGGAEELHRNIGAWMAGVLMDLL